MRFIGTEIFSKAPAALTVGILALAGCAHSPRERPAGGPMAVTPPSLPAPAAADTPPATPAGAEEPAPAVGLAAAIEPAAPPAPVTDLFERMRAGFQLPDDPTRRATDDELAWYASHPDYLERAFARAELYLYHIISELEARGMPRELALLPVVESAFEPYAFSRASASGLWQFIPGTGSRYGLKQDWWYDGRRDIVESTRAALDYLSALHEEFNGDWLLAIAAYNCGELNVERAIDFNKAANRPLDFWNLRLPAETRAYVPKLLAMRRLVAHPNAYGLSISPIPNQPYFARVDTQGQINLKLAAEIAGVTPEEVYELNPAFHRWATDPAGPHFLLLPVDAAEVFSQNIAQLTADEKLGVGHYLVRRGDSVESVAKHYGTTANVIRELNDLPRGRLTVGADLRVPAAVFALPPKVVLAAARVDGRGRAARRPHVHVVREGDSLYAIARRHHMSVQALARLNGMRPGDPLRAGQHIHVSARSADGARSVSDSGQHAGGGRRVTYVVRSGDTLGQIARLFQVKVSQILAWNGMSSHTPILAGQKLTIRVATRRS